MHNQNVLTGHSVSSLQFLYRDVRAQSLKLTEAVSEADATPQSMPDASPAKWHLAHTTWFFETFVLSAYAPDYRVFNPQYNYLFNSYYEAVGKRHSRAARGMLTRPSLSDVRDYRAHVDQAMADLFEIGLPEESLSVIELGVHHEQQHQELLLTDILHLFAQNPLAPAYAAPQPLMQGDKHPRKLEWLQHSGGLCEIGHNATSDATSENAATANSFAFDCEGPRHEVRLYPFEIADRVITNGEWLEFMEDGGYSTPLLWLSDGWAMVQQYGWSAPLYWQPEGGWTTMTLRGRQALDLAAPVTHISYYEADAYATWASTYWDGARLPSEAEWEVAAGMPGEGNFVDNGRLRPAPQESAQSFYGDVWEWTNSAFAPYPGFQISDGAIGEYNGKFMSGQMVLRGGSCVTPAAHIRASYRNFFAPDKRWQFSGVRLARDHT